MRLFRDLIAPGRAYAGIGSRDTPVDILAVMTAAGRRLAEAGMILRSGRAPGADQAFETGVDLARADGCPAMKEIFLPWPGFEKGFRSTGAGDVPLARSAMEKTCFDLARRYHRAFDRQSIGTQRLLARNGQQVLGERLDRPSAFLLCWTPDAAAGGGTGQAIRIARSSDHSIPVFDMGDPEVALEICRTLDIDIPPDLDGAGDEAPQFRF